MKISFLCYNIPHRLEIHNRNIDGGNRRVIPVAKRLVFVGGGHAHLTCLKSLHEFGKLGHNVALISPSPYHYYSGMGPGMLSGIYRPQEVRFNIKKMTEDRGATFKEGKVVRIDPNRRFLFLASGEEIPYDVVSFNTGSDVPMELLTSMSHDNIFPVKPVINLFNARETILGVLREGQRPNFVVVGGGAAGLEITANLWRLVHEAHGSAKITNIAGKRLMSGAPERVRDLAMNSFSKRGVEVIEGSYVKTVEREAVLLDDGRRLSADYVFMAVGIKPSLLFKDSGMATGRDDGLLVNTYLQSVAHPEIFGGGDCINLKGHDLAKVGVYAVRENPILYRNLRVALDGGTMKSFIPQKTFLLIYNMGNGKGIFWKKNWVWDGRMAFLLKDYIDRSFMKKFQVSGERNEV
jgi:NADH dehydrogenase FAD-containing subunit